MLGHDGATSLRLRMLRILRFLNALEQLGEDRFPMELAAPHTE